MNAIKVLPDPSPTITCPSCKAPIRLTESLAAPLIEAARAELEERLEKERAAIASEEARKARAALAEELRRSRAELELREEQLADQGRKIAAARERELELLRKERALAAEREELELVLERRLREEASKLRDEARARADEEARLRIADKDKIISDMQRQVEELRRKAEQGSQQLQGEVLELQLEGQLRSAFPRDLVEAVPKGEHGGDLLQRVLGPGGAAGTILWEMKRTKHFSQGWLEKLREDQRAAHADLAILVSHALPEHIDGFGQHDGVWLAAPRAALPLAACLRQLLVEVALARKAADGVESKMELVYQYLTGPRFRQRVQAMVESFSTLQEDLDKERRVITKQWAKREQVIARAMRAAAGMYGDLQGIAGKSLQELDGLQLAQLEMGVDDEAVG